jgi:DNA (cytosine-5)-methyltransferase 1
MKVLDLFSGIGGFSLGLERAGMTTVAFCEVDKKCQKVLAKHWPEVPVFDDVRILNKGLLDEKGISVDVICGGFPCQDISLAGKGAGIEGERSGLWSEFARLIGELRPKYVIVENVTALLSRGLDRVLGDLASFGYDAEWHCIPASAVGLPHLRDRIWIIAYPQCFGRICLDKSFKNESSKVNLSSSLTRWANTFKLLPTVGELFHELGCDIVRNDDGLSNGMDRLKQLGNAVVPQIPELIGKAIMAKKDPTEAGSV